MHINSLRHDTESTLNKQVGKASSLHMGGTAPKAMDVITIPWISETCPRANKLLWTVSHNTNYNQMHAMQQLLWTVSNNATSYFNLQTENVPLKSSQDVELGLPVAGLEAACPEAAGGCLPGCWRLPAGGCLPG